MAPLRGSDLYPGFLNLQHTSFQQLCLQPYRTRHTAPSCSIGCFVWVGAVRGLPRATRVSRTAGVLGSDLLGRIRARTRQSPGGVWGGGFPGCFLVGKIEEIDFTASSLRQLGGSPRAAAGCAIGLRVLEPEGVELWRVMGPEWDPELMNSGGAKCALREGARVRGFGSPGCAQAAGAGRWQPPPQINGHVLQTGEDKDRERPAPAGTELEGSNHRPGEA